MADITFQGESMTLSGTLPEVGDDAPSFRIHKNPVEAISFDGSLERPLVLTTAPSVDTPVCASQLKSFNDRLQDAEQSSFDVWFVTRDLPFALDRFCGEHGIETALALTDYKERALGESFGLEVRELGLLARTVFVIDTDGQITYRQIVSEIADQPDYDAAIDAVSQL